MFLLGSMILGAGAQVLFKAAFNMTGPVRMSFDMFTGVDGTRLLLLFSFAGILLVCGFLLWMLSLSRLDLSFAYPIACASALLVMVFSVIFLGEAVTLKAVAGVVLITLGTALLVPSQ